MCKIIVEAICGKLQGRKSAYVYAFKGVPYAASTHGHRRFRPPIPPKPWTGIREAIDYGPASPQPMRIGNAESQELRSRAWALDLWGKPSDLSRSHGEDCLVLNVWTPRTDGARRPVMVWFHGGGFVGGSGSWSVYDGSNLSRRGDVVVVTVNHRLGIMGYLNLAGRGGSEYQESGSAGMLDCVAALRWVRDNIEAFGGDAGNVTIFGESGGAAKVAWLLAAPVADGLFQRAVIQSGGGGESSRVGWDRSLRLADEVLYELGVDQVEDLSEVPVGRLVQAQQLIGMRSAARDAAIVATTVRPWSGHGMAVFSPPHKAILPSDSFASIAAGKSKDIPLMIGVTADETALMGSIFNSVEVEDEIGLLRALSSTLGPYAAEIASAYRALCPKHTHSDLLTAISTDHIFRIPSIRMTERRIAAEGGPVYMYIFARGIPVEGKKLKAVHGIEVPYVFDNLNRAPACGSGLEAEGLAAAVSEAWIQFARAGKPGHTGLPAWPEYCLRHRVMMIFDNRCRVERDCGRSERRIWDRFADNQFGSAADYSEG